MSWKRIIIATVVMIGAAASSGARRPPSHSVLRVALTEPRKDVEALRAQGYDVIVVAHDQAWADVIAHGDDARTALRLLGFETLQEEALDGHYGVDSGYHTPEEVEKELKDYAQRYPDLVTLRSVGKSGEGRDIWAVKLTSDNYAQIATKPVVLFNAMHHAREVMSTEIALDTIEYLLTRYGQDPKATHWLNENEIWVLPMLNVDGNNMVWHSDNMWRKNTTGGYGVDINRNYPYAWNTCNGSSGNRGADDYHGPSAGSEPETKVMTAFLKEIRPVVSISYHSYGEMVLYPYGCDGKRSPREDTLETIGKELASKIPSDSGRGTYKPGTSWELLYAVDGGDIDWMYHELHTLPFVIEVTSGFGSNGFQPPFSRRNQTVESLRGGWQYLLDRLDGPGIRGRVTDAQGRPVAGVKVTIGGLNYETGADGSYHALLAPGSYRVEFKAGSAEDTAAVLVKDQRKALSVRL